MRLLVLAGRDDFHARVVQHALQERGHRVDILATDDFFLSDTLSLEVSSKSWSLGIRLSGEEVDLRSYDCVWNRRPHQNSPLSHVSPEDRAFAQSEIRAAFNGIYRLLEHACWVNPVESIAGAENKILQLRLATECGLDVPETLVSTDVENIRKFIRRWPAVIYKPLTGHVWSEDGKRRATYTSRVTEEDVLRVASISTVPGIYQRCIDRAYEVRVQFCGASNMAMKVELDDASCVDWRLAFDRLDACEPVRLPRAIEETCRNLMSRLGIISGAFDFIVDQDGRWMFLEVNQSGQFLFLEQWCPVLPVLDMFCGFLEDPSPTFSYRGRRRSARYLDTANDLVARVPAVA
ncbi:MvdC/MvdD family ATP grasp protein [Luteimonas sp. SDU101]|uniref:MvdC/MvdD family ATP grasp protein n=1 Tax=unclassified Luteimonas TaxID=2629088 RepID=UPI003EC0937D